MTTENFSNGGWRWWWTREADGSNASTAKIYYNVGARGVWAMVEVRRLLKFG